MVEPEESQRAIGCCGVVMCSLFLEKDVVEPKNPGEPIGRRIVMFSLRGSFFNCSGARSGVCPNPTCTFHL